MAYVPTLSLSSLTILSKMNSKELFFLRGSLHGHYLCYCTSKAELPLYQSKVNFQNTDPCSSNVLTLIPATVIRGFP